MTYRPPTDELVFALFEDAGADDLVGTPAFPGFDRSLAGEILGAAGRFASEVLAPLNRSGDLIGARLEQGRVLLPPGFADACGMFGGGGWNGLAVPEAAGGQGLPRSLRAAAFEQFHAANMAFGLWPLLTQAAIAALLAHGDLRQQRLYLPKLVAGTWSGTMNLTEPQAGSDLSSLTMRAVPCADGSYRLHGQKIFITWGDHEATENIIHLVLARAVDAPPGTRGISLFLAPKFLVGDRGEVGARNGIRVGRLEHKLGIHASPTCEMVYDDAGAELVGALGAGLPQMFTMMNEARLAVGVEGVGIAERAYQEALAYARSRRQGRSPWSDTTPAPIVAHPDVRRMLLTMRSKIAAARALCLATAVAADLAATLPADEARDRARRRVELLTPVAKAWSTEVGVEVASLALQIHGGAGYVEETGIAQHLRDARIAPIYEGTNGIQAIDLVTRKLAMENGALLTDLLSEIDATVDRLSGSADERLRRLASPLGSAVRSCRGVAAWLATHRGSAAALEGATDFLILLGHLTGGWLLSRSAVAGSGPRSESRRFLAGFYADHVLSHVASLAIAATSGTGHPIGGDAILDS